METASYNIAARNQQESRNKSENSHQFKIQKMRIPQMTQYTKAITLYFLTRIHNYLTSMCTEQTE